MQSGLAIFRKVAFWEGISFLVLLFIAMPLKYIWGMPLAVKAVGWMHGVLFIAYIAYGYRASREEQWSWLFSGIAFAASLVPFGTFWLDSRLKGEAS